MHETSPSSDELALSAADLAVLKAFDAIVEWPVSRTENSGIASSDAELPSLSSLTPSHQEEDDEMFMIFLTEVQEDISKMSNSLRQLTQATQINIAHFVTMQRIGHKLHGTAAAIDFPLLSTIAAHVETISEQVQYAQVFPVSGIHVLSLATSLLEQVLQEISLTGNEPAPEIYLTQLDTLYHNLNIDLSYPTLSEPRSHTFSVQTQSLLHTQSLSLVSNTPNIQEAQVSAVVDDVLSTEDEYLDEDTAKHIAVVKTPPPSVSTNTIGSLHKPMPFLAIPTNHVASLEHHTAPFLEKQVQLEDAQSQVEAALQDLHVAQTRLQRLEKMLPLFHTNEHLTAQSANMPVNLPSSSFVARILHDLAPPKKPSAPVRDRPRYRPPLISQSVSWDELDLEQYTEKDLLLRSLSEAIADVTVCSVHVNKMCIHLSTLQQEYIAQVSRLRKDTLLLGVTPLRSVVPHLQEVITLLEQEHHSKIVFTATGEETEIDQDLLHALFGPLTQLFQLCIVSSLPADEPYSDLYHDDATNSDDTHPESVSSAYTHRVSPLNPIENVQHISLYAYRSTHGVIIEVSFSLAANSGAIDTIYPTLQRLNCQITTRSNTTGGIVFILHLPHSHNIVRCLLVRCGTQDLLVPFAQVQHIFNKSDVQLDLLCDLHTLLGFPATSGSGAPTQIQPLLLLSASPVEARIGIVVDEVISDVELVTKQLPSYLQRPGIAGTAIDGKGRALLVLDLFTLVQQYNLHTPHAVSTVSNEQNSSMPTQNVISILLADDSVSVRRSVKRMLQSPVFVVTEAHDGVEALEKMLAHVPDILLLDIEMPNLNGYDLLHILPNYPKLAHVRTVMLSSRSSHKHQQRARELGAHAYLTKPTTPELLLDVIQNLHR